ncbi:MAG: DNA-binding response regulator [Geobacter sp.]|nr:MAG: DNA-binding response regulator [Geobacter sp.]
MNKYEKIVIVDEVGFSRICHSILLEQGFKVESLVRGEMELSQRLVDGVSLLITSYPFGKSILSRVHDSAVPVIILVDHLGKEIIELLEELDNCYCMVKPIDYRRFSLLVKDLVRNSVFHFGGYSLV